MTTEKVVKAVWIFSERDAVEIHPKFEGSNGIWVCVDQEEKHWFGSFSNVRLPPIVGDPGHGMVDFDYHDPNDQWNTLKFRLLANALGPPTFGHSEFFGGHAYQRSVEEGCRCDMITLMNCGCPSTKGGQCPSI